VVDIDWSEKRKNRPESGIYRLAVKDAVLKRSKNGDQMFEITFKNIDEPDWPVKDWIMIEGKARQMGLDKLLALGFERGSGIEPHEFIDRRVYAACDAATRTWSRDGVEHSATDLKIDIKATSPWCGLWPDGFVPPGYKARDDFYNTEPF